MIGIHHQHDKSLITLMTLEQRKRACEILRSLSLAEMLVRFNKSLEAAEDEYFVLGICMLVKLSSFEPTHMTSVHACMAKKLFELILMRVFGEKVLSKDGWYAFKMDHPYSEQWLRNIEHRCKSKAAKQP